ncbi:MAG: NHL repeat-containing protein, partial [Thermomicrobiales bacterium]|nr:NHL repeat-containing protein [Thermomicrobiales bacterium]
DGFADVIVGAQLHDGNGPDSGMVEVLSGLDGAVLHSWVGDGADDHFRIFSPEGELLDTWGEHGTGDGQFDFGGVGDIAFASDGTFYVADTANRRVQQFAPDRTFVRAWSDVGNWSGPLASPTTANVLSRPNVVSVAPDGSVYVTDDMRNVVEHYTADGLWLNTLGAAGGQERLNFPGGVAFDQDGNTWVADYGRNRLAIFAPDGAYLGEVTGILMPSDLYFDDAGRLVVADSKGLQVMNEDLQPVGRLWRNQGAYAFVPSAAPGPGDRVYAVDYNLGFLTAFQLRNPLPDPPADATPLRITPAS